MITAKEARLESLKNPTFQRKTELYEEVGMRIKKACAEGKQSVQLTEEEFYALHKEMLDKGYKYTELNSFIACLSNTYTYNF